MPNLTVRVGNSCKIYDSKHKELGIGKIFEVSENLLHIAVIFEGSIIFFKCNSVYDPFLNSTLNLKATPMIGLL